MEQHWLERMQRTLKYLLTTAQWEPYEAEGITHKGTAVLPGYGLVTLYRLDNGEEVLTEATMDTLLRYTDYERLIEEEDDHL